MISETSYYRILHTYIDLIMFLFLSYNLKKRSKPIQEKVWKFLLFDTKIWQIRKRKLIGIEKKSLLLGKEQKKYNSDIKSQKEHSHNLRTASSVKILSLLFQIEQIGKMHVNTFEVY